MKSTLATLSLLSLAVAAAGQQANFKSYTVSPDFREVANKAAFLKEVPLTDSHQAMLRKNLFTCAPSTDDQLYWIYAENDYANIPSLVTVDSMMQLYHVLFDSTLRNSEVKFFSPAVQKLSTGMLSNAINTFNAASGPDLKQASLRNVAYFAIALKALGMKPAIPALAQSMVDEEWKKIEAHEGLLPSTIFPYKIDYSMFVPRGHYTKSDALKRYFVAMMWYGSVPFALTTKDGNTVQRNDEQIRQVLLFVNGLYKTNLITTWDNIYEPTTLYVGASNMLTPGEIKVEMDRMFGKDAPVTAYEDPAKFEAFVNRLGSLRKPKIVSKRTGALRGQPPKEMPDAEVQVRFMGQRYIPDSEIMQRLSDEKRLFPSGLDVMGVLGSNRALAILDANASLYNPNNWADYLPERGKLVEEFRDVSENTWKSNLYWGWLYCLKAWIAPAPENSPAFMKNQAWTDKSLNSSLASWAALRHDTLLYGEQSGAEMGDGDEKQPYVRGFVEPNPAVFDRLTWLTKTAKDSLSERKMLDGEQLEDFKRFQELLAFLRSIVVKELSGQKVTKEEHWEIRKIEGEMDSLTTSLELKGTGKYSLTAKDMDMALVADVHTGGTECLEVASGRANHLIAIVPIEGKLYFARGSTLSYYEFTQPISDRLTDDAWKEMLENGQGVPPRPAWIKSFFVDELALPVGG